jgi:hypothetical protein
MLCGLLTAGGGGADEPNASAPKLNEPAPSKATQEPTATQTSTPEAPKLSYQSSCEDDYPVVFQTGDSSENTMTGFRFVGEMDLQNSGDAPARVRAQFTWLFFGGGSTSLTKTMTVPAGAHRKVGFVKPSTLAEVSNMAGHQVGDKLCKARATLLP